MKKFFTLIVVIGIPLTILAEQKGNTQQQQDQLRREMDALRQEMQQKIQTLQDSLQKLQQQLAEQQQPSPNKFFHYKAPESGDYYFMMPDSSTWDHSFNFPCLPEGRDFNWPKDYNLVIPPMPEVPQVEPYEFHFNLPDMQDYDLYKALPYQYHQEVPHTPDAPDLFYYHEKKHKHDDFLRMLPFYNWFKS